MITFLLILFAYLIGSLSSAIIICKLMHLPDPRTTGSKNPGATNALRIGGKKLGIIVLLGDALKGVIAVLVGKLFHASPDLLGLIALAVFLGHVFPIFFKFQGGKGVATAAGAIVALSPLLALFGFVTWAITIAAFRISSLASLVTVALLPGFALFLDEKSFFPSLVVMMIIIVWRHKDNIKRLLKNQEPKIGQK